LAERRVMNEGMSGRRYREEKARLEAEQASEEAPQDQQAAQRRPAPQEIVMSRKTAFQMGIWAAVGATVWFAIVLPLILFVLGVFGLSLF
jgi:fatty acid desaturase